MVLVAVFVMGLGAGILDMVLSPIVAALQPDSRAKALNWLHSFYGIGTVITVLVGAFAFRLGIGWRTTSLTLITVPLLVALGFVNVDLPPLISNKAGERTALRDLCRNSSFVAVNAAIFLGGALELGLAQWLPAYAEMSLGFSKWTGSVSLLAFSAAMALGRILAGLIGRRVDSIRLMLGCLDFRCALPASLLRSLARGCSCRQRCGGFGRKLPLAHHPWCRRRSFSSRRRHDVWVAGRFRESGWES